MVPQAGPLEVPGVEAEAVVQGFRVVVVVLVLVGKGSSIPVVDSILPKLVYNLAGLLVVLCHTKKEFVNKKYNKPFGSL